jgi:hypothetical protein
MTIAPDYEAELDQKRAVADQVAAVWIGAADLGFLRLRLAFLLLERLLAVGHALCLDRPVAIRPRVGALLLQHCEVIIALVGMAFRWVESVQRTLPSTRPRATSLSDGRFKNVPGNGRIVEAAAVPQTTDLESTGTAAWSRADEGSLFPGRPIDINQLQIMIAAGWIR